MHTESWQKAADEDTSGEESTCDFSPQFRGARFDLFNDASGRRSFLRRRHTKTDANEKVDVETG